MHKEIKTKLKAFAGDKSWHIKKQVVVPKTEEIAMPKGVVSKFMVAPLLERETSWYVSLEQSFTQVETSELGKTGRFFQR
jgi:hypothetical protein